MDEKEIQLLLANYQALLTKIEAHTGHIEEKYKDQMACKKGCDTCCKFLSLFPVEALAIAHAFKNLSGTDREMIIQQLKINLDACPLLINRECALYSARSIICRTHGYPIFLEKDGESVVDFCPKNFKETTQFSSKALLNVDQLNTMLSAVNRHFIDMIDSDLPDRISISEALFLLMNDEE